MDLFPAGCRANNACGSRPHSDVGCRLRTAGQRQETNSHEPGNRFDLHDVSLRLHWLRSFELTVRYPFINRKLVLNLRVAEFFRPRRPRSALEFTESSRQQPRRPVPANRSTLVGRVESSSKVPLCRVRQATGHPPPGQRQQLEVVQAQPPLYCAAAVVKGTQLCRRKVRTHLRTAQTASKWARHDD